jgi:hypothetical protein
MAVDDGAPTAFQADSLAWVNVQFQQVPRAFL